MRVMSVGLAFGAALFGLVVSCIGEVKSEENDLLFSEHNNDSRVRIEYGPLDDLLEMTVWDTGRSDREYASPPDSRLGTRVSQGNRNPTRLEGNRVFFHEVKPNNIRSITEYRLILEAIPQQLAIARFSRSEQLAYWLNLHNIAVYEQLAKSYPISNLHAWKQRTWYDKFINVEGTALSINDIEQRILANWSDPLVIYGMYQGTIGGPNIRTKSFNGRTVFQRLEENAVEFTNSLRGLRFRGDDAYVSEFYAWNASFFPNFEYDLRQHLMIFADPPLRLRLSASNQIIADVYDWYIADLYNGQFAVGASSDNPAEFALGQSIGSAVGTEGVGNSRTPTARDVAVGGGMVDARPATGMPNNNSGGMSVGGFSQSVRISDGFAGVQTNFPAHVDLFISEIMERNARARTRVTVEEVDQDTEGRKEPNTDDDSH